MPDGGSLVSAVIRIAIIAATLALVYYFVIRPVLDTTERVSSGMQGNIEKSLESVNEAFGQAGGTGRKARIKRQIRGASGADQQRLSAMRPAGRPERQPDPALRRPVLPLTGGSRIGIPGSVRSG